MNRFSNLLLAAALGLAVVGGAIAVIQPGDMGDDDPADVSTPDDTDGADEPGTTDTSDDDPVVGGDTSETTDPDDAEPAEDPTVTSETTEATSTSSTTQATTSTTSAPADGGSGLDSDGTASPESDDLAATGAESMLLAAAALAVAGLAVRRRSAA